MHTKPFFRPLLASSLLFGTLFHGGASFADDTEIFFGGSAIDQGIRPNVLFILDDSGSMAYCLDRDSSRCNGGPTRMPTMKDTFATLLNGTTGVNVGVMDLNQTSNGSRILSPVQYIEQSINTKMPTPSLASGTDDVTRQTTGTTGNQLSDGSLVMGYIRNSDPNTTSITRSLSSDSTYSNNNSTYYLQGNTYTCSAKAASSSSVCAGPTTTLNARSGNGTLRYDGLFLFRNLNIPAGVTITDAKLYVTTTTDTASRTFNIWAVNSKTPGAFNDSTQIDTSIFTNPISKSSVKVGTTLDHSLDVTALLQDLKAGAPANNPISDVVLRLRSSNNNNFIYNVGDTTSSPKLVVTYSSSEDNARTTGLRFQTVSIPQGANITSARIDFVPAGSDDRPVTFDVTAQNTGNAATFTATENFTARTQTSAASWSAPEWRTQNPPVYVQGPDVRAQVQAVVSSSSWCGNNAMAFFLTPTSGSGSRVAYSYDDGSSLQPVLKITYTGGDNGCLNPILDISMLDPKDDGRQYFAPGSWFTPDNPNKVSITETSVPLETTASRVGNSIIGARFQKVPVKPGATVLEAGITVTPNSATGTTGTVNVSFERTSNSAAFSAADNNLGARTKTSGTSCTFTSVGVGIPVTCKAAGLVTTLQSVFATTNNWVDGNALSVFLTQPSTSNLTLRTYENSPADAIKLNIKLQTGGLGSNSYTIRNYTNDLVQNMQANGGTPLVPALYEAAGYLTQLSTKHNNSLTSPITSSCQATYLVLLTDGQANENTTSAKNGIAGMTGTTCASVDDGERCGRELTKWLANTDQTDFEGTNYVTTHTIGFALQANQQAQTFLDDLAKNGGGKSYTANNASDLAKAFNAILQEALSTNTTFVNSSAPVNSFNRQDNKDQLYFALFRPSATDRWPGNLKRYRLKTENGVATIVDADGAAAIDPNTGFFKDNAQSFWPDTDAGRDGNDIAKGGAAHKLPVPANRKLFTFYGTVPSGGVNLNADAYKLLPGSGNPNLTATMFEVGNTTLKDQAITYIRGLDSNGTTARYALGDMIHSTPRLFTYGCKGYNSAGQCLTTSGEDNSDQYAIVGSNEGFVQLFDTSSGVEQFGFMPEALLPNVDLLRADDRSTSQKPRRYGMDNSVTVWVNDVNNNGVIYGDPATRSTSGLNTGEFVYAYATMGRGGRNVYALDITDKGNPKLLWQINGGSGSFTKLGQTWSAPVKTRINVGGTITDVLIFAGGYDPNQDTLNNGDSVYTADTQGNAIYIVNARTGELIWSASNSSGHTANLTKMRYSIPSAVRVIDIQKDAGGALVSDNDHLADQFFVGDMGGQVWRFYINNGQSGASLITPGGTSNDGVFASIGGTTPASARRFYQEPDVALLNVKGTPALSINIGSGYRGHPLNQVIQDRFYAFRTPVLVKPSSSEGTLTESSLYNATENLVQGSDATTKQAAANAFASTSGGWYITLKASGEKVLSRALTAGGQLYFNTYEPSSANALCKASVGRNRSYAVRLLDATPVSVPISGNGTYADRYTDSNSEGIAGDPQLYCIGNDCYVLPDPSIEPDKIPTPPLGKTYWMDTNNL
ncbi:PilC/PilY family type IV pilus protein [Pseudomonas citronellolis]|uniref:PilC/PilY family type IV pilus protein n=1 Tax=Pseudomonas citronellolis TaxID=53408 RepID=UPI0021BF255B|nr:PilC/PilY family type IV pilus protein [Pseudomonas citronellolis]UXJ51807.1 PilC/PilY family type IV pilus protein [Pseudomonas citronellolis]